MANGLLGIKSINIDTCIISGLGSNTILNILYHDDRNIKRYVLCPNGDAYLLRKWIKDNTYYVENELIIKEKKMIYEVIIVNKLTGRKVKNYEDVCFGPILRFANDEVFLEKWFLRKKYYQLILEKNVNISNKKYKYIEKKLKFISRVI